MPTESAEHTSAGPKAPAFARPVRAPRSTEANSARTLPLLPRLFPESVATHELGLREETDPLHPAEHAHTERFVESRLLEFKTGRHCARHALRALGISGKPVLRGSDRAPVWPLGVVGSISHTGTRSDGWCGAAVASTDQFRGIGLDIERDEPLDEPLWRIVLTPSEVARLRAAPSPPRDKAKVAKLVFSAKECAYKCQYPLTRRFLNFHAFEVLIEWNTRRFEAVCQEALHPDLPKGSALEGRFAIERGLLLTALTL